MTAQPPVVLLVYANDRVDPSRHLRNLSAEIGLIRDALQPAEQAGLCQILIEANATAGRVFAVFQDARYRNRIAILHYAGHADGYRLLLESAAGSSLAEQGPAHAAGLAAFLGEQQGLELVFLNGCSTAPQVQGLLDAGCPAVIATSQAIDDRVATELAGFFYQGLGGGAGLESAFKAAVAATRTTHGDSPRGLYWGSATEPAPLAERWPWDFHTKPGAERAQHWNLPEAADDPLFGLPALPQLDLPESPFRHLSWFDREHAEVFFGRAFQVRELFDRITAPDAPPILLLYGQSGVGKSSVLAAGLLPRLEASHRVHYLRRDPALGLFGTLMQPLGAGADGPGTAWRQAETDAQAPLLLILDQLEEVFTRPAAKPAEELATFFAGLQAIFGQPQTRPRGRLILSFRKEWLPEIEARLADQRLPRGRLFLEGLDRRGIIAAVEGATRGERLRNAYGLQIDPGLTAEIADDLLADPDSPIAPTLQILLTKLWVEARQRDDAHPRFTRDLYLKLKRDGILLKDFLDQQLAALEQWRPEVVQSGLALDLLAAHTTPTGTADQRTEQELLTSYAQVRETLPTLLQRCTDEYLLTDIPSTGQEPVKGTRLAHDTIAPLVRARFEESDRPGQRALRILDNRAVEWRSGESGAVLDEADLEIVEGGSVGMRDWDADEHRLIEESRRAREQQQRAKQRRRLVAAIGIVAIVIAGGFSAWQWQQAERQTHLAIARELVLQSEKFLRRDTRLSLALAYHAAHEAMLVGGQVPADIVALLKRTIEANPRVLSGPGAQSVAWSPDGTRLLTGGQDNLGHVWEWATQRELGVLRGHEGWLEQVAWSPDGHFLATAARDGTARLWDAASYSLIDTLDFASTTVQTVSFHPHEPWLAVAHTAGLNDTPMMVVVWDFAQRRERFQVPGFRAAFSPDGTLLATTDGDGDDWGVVQIFDLQGRHLGDLHRHERYVHSLSWAPDGRRLATASVDDTVRIWGAAQGRSERVIKNTFALAVAWSPDGRYLASGSGQGRVKLWDTLAFTELGSISSVKTLTGDPTNTGASDYIESVAWSPDSAWLAVADRASSLGGTGDGSVCARVYTTRMWTTNSASELLETVRILGTPASLDEVRKAVDTQAPDIVDSADEE
jgi:WD40 repeat protein